MRMLFVIIVFLMLLGVMNCKSTKETAQQAVAETKADSGSDSLFAMLKRTPCYGQCPIYSISIYKSGFVKYEGIRFVDSIGTFNCRISKNQMKSIIEKAKEIGYFEFENEYDSPVTDFPTTYTYLAAEGKTKNIKNRVAGPEKLKEFEKFIDAIFINVTWERADMPLRKK